MIRRRLGARAGTISRYSYPRPSINGRMGGCQASQPPNAAKLGAKTQRPRANRYASSMRRRLSAPRNASRQTPNTTVLPGIRYVCDNCLCRLFVRPVSRPGKLPWRHMLTMSSRGSILALRRFAGTCFKACALGATGSSHHMN